MAAPIPLRPDLTIAAKLVDRLRGTFHLQRGESANAERWLNDAINLARSQAARSLDLRAATDLARLWRGQGRHTEANKLLALVSSWFTEGFGTPEGRQGAARCAPMMHLDAS
jgi:predicted ATPase